MLVGPAFVGQFAVSANDGASQMTALVIVSIVVSMYAGLLSGTSLLDCLLHWSQ